MVTATQVFPIMILKNKTGHSQSNINNKKRWKKNTVLSIKYLPLVSNCEYRCFIVSCGSCESDMNCAGGMREFNGVANQIIEKLLDMCRVNFCKKIVACNGRYIIWNTHTRLLEAQTNLCQKKEKTYNHRKWPESVFVELHERLQACYVEQRFPSSPVLK